MVVKKFTFAISSPDEFLYTIQGRSHGVRSRTMRTGVSVNVVIGFDEFDYNGHACNVNDPLLEKYYFTVTEE